MFGYSLSLPWESRHFLYITDASTFAGEYVFGSLSSDITDSNIVRTFWVGFHRSSIRSPTNSELDTIMNCVIRNASDASSKNHCERNGRWIAVIWNECTYLIEDRQRVDAKWKCKDRHSVKWNVQNIIESTFVLLRVRGSTTQTNQRYFSRFHQQYDNVMHVAHHYMLLDRYTKNKPVKQKQTDAWFPTWFFNEFCQLIKSIKLANFAKKKKLALIFEAKFNLQHYVNFAHIFQ